MVVAGGGGDKFWYLDGHASAVEALWEEHLLATKPVESCGKLQLQTGRDHDCHVSCMFTMHPDGYAWLHA